MVAKILVVDDEPNIRDVVGLYLRRDGHAIVVAADGEEALRLYHQTHPDLVVLDLMLPKLSGIEVCRRLGAESGDRRVPLIMLTARDEEEDRIVGLGLGADDYVTKPFSPRELAARVEAVLRRVNRAATHPAGGEALEFDGLRIDPRTRVVNVRGETATLTARTVAAAATTPVYAVDVSVWSRCDVEASPERGYYHHPSRHSAGQPIVAGWAYQWIAQLGFARDGWVASMDIKRVRPLENPNEVAAEQVKGLLLRRLPQREEKAPLFVFDAGYDPVQLQQGLEYCRAQILVRLRAGRCFYADPPPPA